MKKNIDKPKSAQPTVISAIIVITGCVCFVMACVSAMIVSTKNKA